MNTNQIRNVERIVRGRPTSDGAGVRLNRLIGTPELPRIDPFLMLDEFRSDSADDYIAGFPNHPHRGFETVTYMLAGRLRHGDNLGNSGLLTAGSVQWMTAGRGIVHSEMPEQEDGLMWGFQLWVNLPARDKMTAPRYQDIAPEQIPVLHPADGVTVKLLAGSVNGQQGPVQAVATEPLFLDIRLAPGTRWSTVVPRGHQGFVYPVEGNFELGAPATVLEHGELGVLGDHQGVDTGWRPVVIELRHIGLGILVVLVPLHARGHRQELANRDVVVGRALHVDDVVGDPVVHAPDVAVAQGRADQGCRDRLRDREARPATVRIEAEPVALEPQLAVVHDDEAGVALARHVGVDVDGQFERRAGWQRPGGVARRDHPGLREHRQAVEGAEGGVALRLVPEQQVGIGRHGRQEPPGFLVQAEPARDGGHGQHHQQSERKLQDPHVYPSPFVGHCRGLAVSIGSSPWHPST